MGRGRPAGIPSRSAGTQNTQARAKTQQPAPEHENDKKKDSLGWESRRSFEDVRLFGGSMEREEGKREDGGEITRSSTRGGAANRAGHHEAILGLGRANKRRIRW